MKGKQGKKITKEKGKEQNIVKGWEKGRSVLSESEADERGESGINDSPDKIPISFLGRNRKYKFM